MTNLLLENTNESKVDELMESLVNDYKQSLKTKEEDERYVLEYEKNCIDYIENYDIPFLSNKYGVSSTDKELFNTLLEFIVIIRNGLRNNQTVDKDKVDKFIKDITPILHKLQSRLDNHKKEYELFEQKIVHLNESFETVKIIKELYLENKNKSDESFIFSFHKDTHLKLDLRIKELNLKRKRMVEERDISKQQCLKVIKKINYELDKLKKYWLSSDLSELIKTILKVPYTKLKVKEIDICNDSGRFHFTLILDVQ
jgi:hypothetical protein